MMPATQTSLESMTLTINEIIKVNAPIGVTFESLIESLEDNATPNGPFPMKLEPWPGGRWYRDLGDNNGHFWAVVQAIKRPTLLEFSGPLMMSFASVSNVQYRLAEDNGVTVVTFHHYAFGHVPDDFRSGAKQGWSFMHERFRQRAEKNAKK